MDYPRMSERNEPNAAYKVLRRRLKSLDDDIPDDKTRLIPGRNLIGHLYKECENFNCCSHLMNTMAPTYLTCCLFS